MSGRARQEDPSRAAGREQSIGAARKDCISALGFDPENGLTHFNMGVNLACLGRSEEALEAYMKAVSLDPSLPAGALHHGQDAGLDGVGEVIPGFDHRAEIRLVLRDLLLEIMGNARRTGTKDTLRTDGPRQTKSEPNPPVPRLKHLPNSPAAPIMTSSPSTRT